MRRPSLRLAFSFVVAVMVFLLCAARPVEQATPPDETIFGGEWPDPNTVAVSPEEIVFHRKALAGFESEGNYYMSRFNGGWISMLQVFSWKYGPMDGWGLYALVISPDGKRYFKSHQFNEKAVKISEDYLFFQEGPNLVEMKGEVFRVKLNVKDFACDLTYRNNVPVWRPGDGFAYFDAKKGLFHFTVITCPWADVTGTIKLPDITLEVKGEGYSDKTRATGIPTKMSPYLYSIRVFSPPGTPREDRWMFGLLEHRMHPSYGSKRIPFLHLCHNNKIVMATKHYSIEPSQWTKGLDTPYDYPQRIKIRAKDRGWILEGEYTCAELFDFLDVLAELPGVIRRMAAKFVRRPVYFRSHGKFEAVVTSPDGKRARISLIGPHEYIVIK